MSGQAGAAVSASADVVGSAGWRYRAIDGAGRSHRGVIDARDRDDAAAQLFDRGLAVETLTPAATRAIGGRRARRAPRWTIGPTPGARLSRAGARLLFAQLAQLLSHGAPLDHALAIAADETPEASARAAARRLVEAVRNGRSVADAVADEGGGAPPHAAGMIAAGEASGRLAEALTRLSDAMEREAAHRRALAAALAYPATVGVVGVLAIGLLLVYVAPQFERAFAAAGADAAPDGQWMIAASRWLRAHGVDALWVVGACLGATMLAQRSPSLRRRLGDPLARRWSALLRATPFFGPIAAARDAGRWCASLGALSSGGVAVTDAMAIAERGLSDPARRDDARRLAFAVASGDALSSALAAAPSRRLWPRLVAHYARIGEETGRLGEALSAASRLLEQDAEARAKLIAAAAGPALILSLGGLVGLLAASMMSAALSINDLAL